jgi:hypothetical protein
MLELKRNLNFQQCLESWLQVCACNMGSILLWSRLESLAQCSREATFMTRDLSRPQDYERVVVVDAEVSKERKTGPACNARSSLSLSARLMRHGTVSRELTTARKKGFHWVTTNGCRSHNCRWRAIYCVWPLARVNAGSETEMFAYVSHGKELNCFATH